MICATACVMVPIPLSALKDAFFGHPYATHVGVMTAIQGGELEIDEPATALKIRMSGGEDQAQYDMEIRRRKYI